MEIKKTDGKKTIIWSVNDEGFGWYETYGPSLTDFGTFKSINHLLNLTDDNQIKVFEKSLPPEIKGLKNVLEILLVKINDSSSGITEYNLELVSRIKERIKEL